MARTSEYLENKKYNRDKVLINQTDGSWEDWNN